MIRLSSHKDIDGIIKIWEESFGDSEQDIMFFLDNCFVPENTLVYEMNGEVASLLFLLEGDMHIKNCDYPSYYLYAACTLKKYRGRGLMGKLLKFAEQISSERNKHFIVLKPAEKSLYNFYAKYGYKSVFTKRILTLPCDDSCSETENVTNCSDDFYSVIRDSSYYHIDYFKWNNSSVLFAIKHHKYYGGEEHSACKGYLLYTANDCVLTVKECAFTDEKVIDTLKNLAKKCKCNKIYAEIPFGFCINNINSVVQESGMILPVNNDAEKIVDSLKNAYLGLTLD